MQLVLTEEFLVSAPRFSGMPKGSQVVLPLIKPGVTDGRSRLIVFDAALETAQEFSLPIRHAHFAANNPVNPRETVVLDLKWKEMCLVDCLTGAVLRSGESMPGHFFGGHAAFSQDGKFVYTAEFDRSTEAGKIAVRDSQSLQILDAYQTYSFQPHDFRFDWKNSRLTVGHYGKGPFFEAGAREGDLTVIDLNSRELIRKFSATEPNTNLCHIEFLDEDNVVVVSRDWYKLKSFPVSEEPPRPWEAIEHEVARPSPVCLANLKTGEYQEFFPNELRERMIVNLGLHVSPKARTAVVTHVLGKSASFWDLGERALKKEVIFPTLVGGSLITPDEKYFIVPMSSGALTFWDVSNFEFQGILGQKVLSHAAAHSSLAVI
jgi:hypothetical protein